MCDIPIVISYGGQKEYPLPITEVEVQVEGEGDLPKEWRDKKYF